MKNLKRISISLLLLISILLSLASCDVRNSIATLFHSKKDGQSYKYDDSFPFPEGYTGGLIFDYKWHLEHEVKWLDTYDELKDAVTRLRAHGTEGPTTVVFDCEEYGLDLKFCIVSTRYRSEELAEGQGYFDRYLSSVSIYTYVFFEDVSIDDMMYDEISRNYKYKYVEIYQTLRYHFNITDGSKIQISVFSDDTLCVDADGEYKFKFKQYHYTVSEEDIAILEKTLVVFE